MISQLRIQYAYFDTGQGIGYYTDCFYQVDGKSMYARFPWQMTIYEATATLNNIKR